ncbi:MAG: (2Fe-2S)-binding protein [Lentilitoribacter sp.]
MQVEIIIDGQRYKANKGDLLVTFMLEKGLVPFRRNPVNHSPRAPFCMMGVCFECLIDINGAPSTQACLVEIEDGMIIKRNVHD